MNLALIFPASPDELFHGLGEGRRRVVLIFGLNSVNHKLSAKIIG